MKLIILRLLSGMFNFFFEIVIDFILLPFRMILGKEYRIKQKLKKVKTKRLTEIKPGDYVKLVGKAKPYQKSLIAPLSKRKCVGYQIEVNRNHGEDTEYDYINEERGIEFYLECEDGDILIIPRHATFHLTQSKKYSSGLLNKPDQNVKDYLARHGEKATFLGFNKSLDFFEGALEEGQLVTIVGRAKRLVEKSGERIMALRATDNFPLIISNK